MNAVTNHAAKLEGHDGLSDVATRMVARQFATFHVGENAYGIDIMAVREIRSWTPTTRLPDQPHGARGVLDICGNIVEVFDLSVVLGSGASGEQSSQVVLVVAINDKDVGLTVDSISDIIDAADADLADPPTPGGKLAAIVRQRDNLISILDLGALFR